MSKNKSQYSEQDIDVLKGLEPVQVRPGMYTTTDNPNHIMQEVVDNAQDEALAGFASSIEVELFEDGSISVEDNGRGIPCGMHPSEKKPVIEVVFTHLHAGGKFKKGEGKTYGFTGGLHGVGVSVTNALSEKLEVTVFRDGYEHSLVFENGKVIVPLKKTKLPSSEKDKTGTRVRSYPNAKYFDNPSLHASSFEEYLKAKAVLLRGTKVVWRRPNKPEQVWQFENGMEQYLKEQVQEEQWFAPVFSTSSHYEEDAGNFEKGEGFDLVVGWNDGKSVRESYVNLIHTKDGGRHESGLRAGLLDAFRKAADRTGALPKNIKLEAEDVWSDVSFVLSVKLMDPQFQNQTKDKMTSEKAHRMISSLLSDSMELYLNDNPAVCKTLLEVIVQNAISRSKQSVKMERKKSSSGLVLPGKLADCLGNDVNSSELFLVEGDSAAGCLSLKNKIPLTDGRTVCFETLIREDKEGKKNYCYTILDDGSVGVGEIRHPRLTKHGVDLLAVHLDNDEVVEVTPDHRFKMRDGSYCRADELSIGASIMPLYRRKREAKDASERSYGKSKQMLGYEEVFNPLRNRWDYTYHLADLYNLSHNIYSHKTQGRFARHHVDFNKNNNNPDNIIRIPWEEHSECTYEDSDVAQYHNHKVKKIEKISGWHDVYDLEVPGTHNFALESGVFVHNSSKLARDKETQAILPLRGKLLNTWEVDHHKLMSSEGVANIASAVGVDPHSWDEINTVDLSKLRYGKVFIMADADVDGQHIQVLLLTLFVKHFPALIKNGHIWIAQAPLFRVDAPAKKGAKGGPRKMYALDDDERESLVKQLEKEGLKEGQYVVSRFKGLGEMNPDQLSDTTMSKESRRALKITISDIKTINDAFDRMMGTKNAKQRKEWMEESGASIEID